MQLKCTEIPINSISSIPSVDFDQSVQVELIFSLFCLLTTLLKGPTVNEDSVFLRNIYFNLPPLLLTPTNSIH
jgi:hypothetical protein